MNELVSVDAGFDHMQRAAGDTPAAHQVGWLFVISGIIGLVATFSTSGPGSSGESS